MGRLRKLNSLDPSLIDETDRYHVFKRIPNSILRMYQREAERVLNIFRQEFPFIATQKSHFLIERRMR